MIIPPIVGVPFFSICPSRPKSRIDSPICFFCKNLMTHFPIIIEIKRERIFGGTKRDILENPAQGHQIYLTNQINILFCLNF